MNYTRRILPLVFAVASVISMAGNAQAQTSPESMTFVELHEVNDIAAARTYAKWAEPIMTRHGGKIVGAYEVTMVVKGMTKPGIVWVYRFANEAGMQAVGTDPEYHANIPNPNKIFNFDSNQLFAVKPIVDSK